jgi:hypothetical protein
LLSLTAAALFAASPVAAAADDAVTQFGKLPARYNGRITTIQSAAASMLKRISGRSTYFDADGGEHSAVEWLLGEATRDENTIGPRILQIENAELLALLKLEARPAAGVNRHRYAFDELTPSFPALEAAGANAAKAPDSEFSDALADLFNRLRDQIALRRSFETPGKTIEELQEALSRMRQLDSSILPLVVPPADAASAWHCWWRGALDDFIAGVVKDAGRKPIPAVPYWREILDARRARDDDRFGKAIAAYVTHLNENPPRPAALDFVPPAGWQELGVSVKNSASYKSDTLAAGAPVAVFLTRDDARTCFPHVIYFPTSTASVERIVNEWRIGANRAPLADDELRKTLTPSRVGSFDALTVDIADAENSPQSPRRVLATIIRRENDAFVITCDGSPEAIETERAHYTAFIESLKLGSPDEAKAWFNLGDADPRNLAGTSFLVITAKRGNAVWQFRVSGLGPVPETARAACMKFIAEFPAPRFLKGGDRAAWAPPAGWKAVPDSDEPAFQLGEGQETRFLMAQPLADYTAASELPLFNHWRGFLGLPAWNAAEAAEQVKTEQLADDTTARVVEFVVPK